MTEAKKGPAEKRAITRASSAEKRGTARDADAEARAAKGLNAALDRFADRIQASNAALEQTMRDSLAFLKDVLHDDQKNRRFWRWVLIGGMVLNFGILGALGYNAVNGAKARSKLLEQNRVAQETLKKVDAATNEAAQKKQAAGLALFLRTVKCDNQRNIQRAMTNLGAPYELDKECQ